MYCSYVKQRQTTAQTRNALEFYLKSMKYFEILFVVQKVVLNHQMRFLALI